MKKTVKVSVIMPSLNVYPYIRQCMESVVSQTLKEIEIICVDAGSTDGTLEILKEYETFDSRVHIIQSDKKSYGYQMNLGICAASGEYIGIIETDDWAETQMFERLWQIACENDVDVVKSNYFWYYTKPEEKNVKFENLKNCPYNQIFDTKEAIPAFSAAPSIWSGIYRRQMLIDNQIRFNEAPGGAWVDNPFMLETLLRAKTICWMPEAFYCYRQTNPNASSFIKDCSMPFERTSEMLGFLDREHVYTSDIRNPLYKRILWNTVSALNNPNYVPEKDDSLIISQLKCIDPAYLDNKWVTQEEKDAYEHFAKKRDRREVI